MTTDQLLDALAAACLLVGAALTLVAAIGMMRLPDLLSRMHAGTKPQVLGMLVALLGLALQLRRPHVVGVLLIVALFQLITSPIASHMVGRASYRAGHMRSDLLIIDEISEAGLEHSEHGRHVQPPTS